MKVYFYFVDINFCDKMNFGFYKLVTDDINFNQLLNIFAIETFENIFTYLLIQH